MPVDSPPSPERRDPASAWIAFVERYGLSVGRWFRQKVAAESDARELTRGLFVQLARQVRTAAPPSGPRFRDWLCGAVHLAWSELRENRLARPDLTADVRALLQSATARDELLKRCDEQWELERFQEALVRVRRQLQPDVWSAFWLATIEGRTTVEVAAALGLDAATICQARVSVGRLLREQLG